jgi:hypothetical protein
MAQAHMSGIPLHVSLNFMVFSVTQIHHFFQQKTLDYFKAGKHVEKYQTKRRTSRISFVTEFTVEYVELRNFSFEA